ncbi:hypothetical protein K461DRAFT_289177 [Myriangium duriaei CBS 260.36]|uniref:DUF4385 domain-containing protein n=1 Tax=Myriangium duriaei CBS 260.36 TaxID=1168546 RepID=A0A9P4J8K7_9PEZI|nr:hypothetical protein K461DRAFT_289177 [Myriangium duriaei CBS 260.36]
MAPKRIKKEASESPPPHDPSPTTADSPLATPSLASTSLRMSYTIGRGETGVLTFEPYKSLLLPLWRFRTPPIARESSATLWDRFEAYGSAGDFVGMDMARKFIQMGMTRAKRYANHKGGRKYAAATADEKGEGKKGRELPRSEGHAGREEKEESSRIFREVWERCRADETYLRLKEEWQKEQKEWKKTRPKKEEEEEEVDD